MDYTYKEVGVGWVWWLGWVGSQRKVTASNRTVWMLQERLVIDPDKPRELKRHLTNTMVNIRSMPPT